MVDLRVLRGEQLAGLIESVTYAEGLHIVPWFEVAAHPTLPCGYTITACIPASADGEMINTYAHTVVTLPSNRWLVLDQVTAMVDRLVVSVLRRSVRINGTSPPIAASGEN